MFSLGAARHATRWCRASVHAALAIVAVAAALSPVLATTVRHLKLQQIVAASDTIVAGRVDSVRSYWHGKQIYTEVAIAVSRSLKGSGAKRVTFQQVGGRVDSPVPLQMTVPGAPVFNVGDEGYFFLEPGEAGERHVVGLFQGHVPLHRDDQGDFVVVEGSRRSPAQFEEDVRREIAGQQRDSLGGAR